MYGLKKRPSARYPFSNAVASLRVVCLLQVAIEPVVVDCRAGNVIWSAVRDGVISVDDVFTIRRLQSWNNHKFD